MSHHTRIKTELADAGGLKATLEEIGCCVQEKKGYSRTPEGKVVESWVRLSFTMPHQPGLGRSGSVLCFAKSGSTFELLGDSDDLTHDAQIAFLAVVRSHYALRQAREKLEAQGFRVEGVERRDGAVQLQLSRDAERVEVDVARDGEAVELAASGFEGERCLAATKALEEALGGVVEERRMTVAALEREMTLEEFFGAAALRPRRSEAYATDSRGEERR